MRLNHFLFCCFRMTCHRINTSCTLGILIIIWTFPSTNSFSFGDNLFLTPVKTHQWPASFPRPLSQKSQQLIRHYKMASLHQLTRPMVSSWWLLPIRSKKLHQSATQGLPPKTTHSVGDNSICRSVCSFCRSAFATRVSALCSSQCHSGGRAFAACLTWMGVYNIHYRQ